jgi:AcrR family transcriptional regulator
MIVSKNLSKRDLILKVSAEHFSEYGYDRTILDNIALDCDLTKPALYYYFRNKESLYQEIICSSFERLKDKVLNVTEEREPIEAIEVYVRTFGEFFVKEPHFSVIFARELSSKSSERLKFCIDTLYPTVNRLFSIIKRGNQAGTFEMENPFMIQLMIISTLTNYHTTSDLREHISKNFDADFEFEPELGDIIESLVQKIKKALMC